MQLSDRITGLFLAGLGLAAAWGGSRLPAVPGQDVGPAAFPMVIGGGLMLCGVMIAFGIGHSFEVPDEEGERHSPAYGLRALLPPGLLLFYALAVDQLGFMLTAAVIVASAAFALGARPKLALPLAIGAPIFVHAVFAKLLRVPLADGILPAFW
jgi:putative tricarboxylic transport membrane protein